MNARILILHPLHFVHYGIHHGIQRFALNRPGWVVGSHPSRNALEEEVEAILAWEPDGIIAMARYKEVERFFSIPELPAVMVDQFHDCPDTVNQITVDDVAIGQQAASYFLQKNMRQLAFVQSGRNLSFEQDRESGFNTTLMEAGIKPYFYRFQDNPANLWFETPGLSAWLKALPKPIGIYCPRDLLAVRVMQACHQAGIRIPSEINIVGTDDDEHLCKSVTPNLSSVPVPREQAGFLAATLLDKHITLIRQGKKPPVTVDRVCPEDVVERQSSSLRMIPDPAIARAVQYLQEEVLLGATIEQAARISGLNRRALERGFRKHLGTSPGKFVQELKLKHAKVLLKETDLRIWEIADSCRMTQENLKNMLKKNTGLTPLAYRKEV